MIRLLAWETTRTLAERGSWTCHDTEPVQSPRPGGGTEERTMRVRSSPPTITVVWRPPSSTADSSLPTMTFVMVATASAPSPPWTVTSPTGFSITNRPPADSGNFCTDRNDFRTVSAVADPAVAMQTATRRVRILMESVG